MNRDGGSTAPNLQALEMLRKLMETDPDCSRCDQEGLRGLQRSALARLVRSLLPRCCGADSNEVAGLAVSMRDSSTLEGLSHMSPEDVGRLYEYLRGFRVERGSDGSPRLMPSVKGKRNEGLFYTPPAVVSHIVKAVLDSLKIQDPVDYLDLRVLDPAVGTGVFLAGALDQMSDRIMAAGEGRVRRALRERNEPVPGDLSTSAALRFHLVENCLYGVDLDPVAVEIARAVLMERASSGEPSHLCPRPRVCAGNSLMGSTGAGPGGSSREEQDCKHAVAYFGERPSPPVDISAWASEKGLFHWPLEFPEIFGSSRQGFDAIVGNPPYEILSSKESGIGERRREQAYFRTTYRTCRGKINTYRLMLERSLELLAPGGVLGFIVPSTLLSDSSAEGIRRLLFDSTEVIETVLIPESARVFKGVTQALLIFVAAKRGRTEVIRPLFQNGEDPAAGARGAAIDRGIMERTGFRVPLLRAEADKKLLAALLNHPDLRGDSTHGAIASVHQGEVNLTTHRRFITSVPTANPLIRGEHIQPFHLVHPSPRGKRLDWVVDGWRNHLKSGRLHGKRNRGRPWECSRIALSRVVNMAAARRLKAAVVPAGACLGDMTNFLAGLQESEAYVLGLLNSRLLDWRIRITSTNNYLSAREIESLPVPRRSPAANDQSIACWVKECWSARLVPGLLHDSPASIADGLALLGSALPHEVLSAREAYIPQMMETLVSRLGDAADVHGRWARPDPAVMMILDALVLLLFGVEEFVSVVDVEEG